MTDEPTRPHSLEDHWLGVDPTHSHEGEDADHDHDDMGADGDPGSPSLWLQDNLALTSVGIDIGSAGTQVVFSRVRLRRMGEALTSRYVVVGRENLYESPIALTPYASDVRIDDRAIGRLVDEAYEASGLHPDQVDAGAVILTGEALRRENAQAIADVLSEVGGEFVCTTAGHHMEAMLAAFGSGAAQVSYDRHEPVLNVDIGGGTTKLALVEEGRVLHTAALHLGGRLAVVDGHRRLIRLDPAGQRLAALAGHEWNLGDEVSDAEFQHVANWMADTLLAAIRGDVAEARLQELWLTEPLGRLGGLGGMMFSGGVSEYVYRREARDFGDLGRAFGAALRARLDAGQAPFPELPAGECIRATALGASQYSVQLSGNTIYISNPRTLLPRRNLQVVRPAVLLGDAIDSVRLTAAIGEHLKRFDVVEGEGEFALAFQWRGEPTHGRLAAFGRGLVDALPRTLQAGRPLVVILDGDVAQTLGTLLKEELGVASDVLVLDGIALWDFDYIDLGRVRMPSFTVPVTIKSLVFSHDPRQPEVGTGHGSTAGEHRHGPGHHHGHGHHHGAGHHHHHPAHHHHHHPGHESEARHSHEQRAHGQDVDRDGR